MHVHRAAGMVGHDPHALANPPARVLSAIGQLDHAVLLGGPDDREVRPLLGPSPGPPSVVLPGERLDPSVEHVPVGPGVADDRGHHREGAIVQRRRAEAHLLEVLERIDAGPQLGHPGDLNGVPRSRGAAHRDHVGPQPPGTHRPGESDRDLALATADRRLFPRVRRAIRVAIVHDPHELEAR